MRNMTHIAGRVILLLVSFLTLISTAANAQSDNCAMTLANAPELRGFKLGMSVKDVTKITKQKPFSFPGDDAVA